MDSNTKDDAPYPTRPETLNTGQPPITGYRNLSSEEVALINEGKALAEQVGAFIEKLRAEAATDKRWVAIGATELQQGFMAAIRGIARPTTF